MGAKPWVGNSVIIVEDSPLVRNELARMYEQIGLKVIGVAENGVIALDLVKQSRPDLVSLDIIMPEMDGVECYKKLRKFDPLIKIVMVTWLGGEQIIQENLKDIIPSHLIHAKGGTAYEFEQRLAKVYGLVPIATPVKVEEIDITADLSALNARVS